MTLYPLIAPRPPRLSEHLDDLVRVEHRERVLGASRLERLEPFAVEDHPERASDVLLVVDDEDGLVHESGF